jgi:phosphoribosyl 1,2-cyclic phosphodiesterase
MEPPNSPPPRGYLRIWGARGTCPAPGAQTARYGGDTPCLSVHWPGKDDRPSLILDAGSGLRRLGQWLASHDGSRQGEQAEPLPVLLSHRHLDHIQGLPHCAPLLDGTLTMVVRTGDDDETSLGDIARSLLEPPYFPAIDGLAQRLTVAAWPTAQPMRLGGYAVHRFPARHPGGAAIVRLDDAEGPLLAYAPDNELAWGNADPDVREWRDGLIAFLHRVPLLLHDATFLAEELPAHVGWGHSSSDEVVRLALACDAGTVLLFHHHPDRDDAAIDAMLRDAEAQAAGRVKVMAAWDGMEMAL